MRHLLAHLFGLALLVSLARCGGENLVGQEIQPEDPGAACTDPQKCCPKESIRCTGNPDGTMICSCDALWDCSKNPNKCSKPMPVPAGGSGWTCSWTASAYVCTGKGQQSTPPGDAGWTCSWNAARQTWTCTSAFPPNPTNTPAGAGSWQCRVDNEFDQLSCDRVAPPAPPPPGPSADAGVPPPPPAPKPDSGVVPPPAPLPGQECVPGQKRWCDGPIYCSWGQQICEADGHWDSCVEFTDGRRPNTACACYHYFFEPKCCETPDCIVPAGSNGQICPKSPGTLCSSCNPGQPECLPGAKCLLTLDSEAFCTKPCSLAVPCPAGYSCTNGQCLPSTGSCLE